MVCATRRTRGDLVFKKGTHAQGMALTASIVPGDTAPTRAAHVFVTLQTNPIDLHPNQTAARAKTPRSEWSGAFLHRTC